MCACVSGIALSVKFRTNFYNLVSFENILDCFQLTRKFGPKWDRHIISFVRNLGRTETAIVSVSDTRECERNQDCYLRLIGIVGRNGTAIVRTTIGIN